MYVLYDIIYRIKESSFGTLSFAESDVKRNGLKSASSLTCMFRRQGFFGNRHNDHQTIQDRDENKHFVSEIWRNFLITMCHDWINHTIPNITTIEGRKVHVSSSQNINCILLSTRGIAQNYYVVEVRITRQR